MPDSALYWLRLWVCPFLASLSSAGTEVVGAGEFQEHSPPSWGPVRDGKVTGEATCPTWPRGGGGGAGRRGAEVPNPSSFCSAQGGLPLGRLRNRGSVGCVSGGLALSRVTIQTRHLVPA